MLGPAEILHQQLEANADISEPTTMEAEMATSSQLTSISVVFPAYNEEANIEKSVRLALQHIAPHFQNIEVIIVNDGSTDQTGPIIDNMAVEDNRVKPVHQQNKGYGGAVGAGISAANNDYVFFTDSDLQFDLSEITRLVEWIRDNDIVVGFRENRADPAHRRLNAFMWGLLVKFLFHIKVRDIDCAFKLFRRDVFQDVTVNAAGAMISTEILALATRHGYKIKEVPVSHYPRQEGEQTGANPIVILKAFLELFRMYARLKKTA